nr:ATP-grasp domain-containing protein [Mammaliicoccus sp. Marseille-Q6498]
MKEYLLLLGAEQFLRERSYSGGKSVGNFQVWTSIKNAQYNYNSYFDFCLNADPLNYDELKEQIAFYKLQGYVPKSIIPLNDWTLKVANKLNKDYGLPHLEENVVEACRNKKEMKRLFEIYGVATPKSKNFYNEHQLRELLNDFSFPVIIKPVDFGGSGGVYLANNLEESLESYKKSKRIMEEYANTFKVSKNEFLLEEFIASDDEVSVEVLCGKEFYKVITVTEKYLSPKPWFTEMGHVVPSHRYKDTNITSLAIDACKSLGINRGVAHVEIKVKGKDLYVIEAAARPGGDAIMDLIESSYGINPYKLHISMYIDNEQDDNYHFKPSKTSAISFLKAPIGEIKKINSPNISMDRDIVRVHIFKKVGDIAGNPENWSDREGLVQFSFPGLPNNKGYKHIEKSDKLAKEIFDYKVDIDE